MKYTWKISRNSSEFKVNFIVECKHNGFTGLGEVAPNIRYHETPESIALAFQQFVKACTDPIQTLDELTTLLDQQSLPNALRFGIESAWVHWYCQKSNQSIFKLFQVAEPTTVGTCYTLPILELAAIPDFFHTYHLNRFPYLKLKVNAESGYEELLALRSLTSQPIMIDGNEAWHNPDDVLAFMNQLKEMNVLFIEQPLPAEDEEAYLYLKPKATLPLMADESVCANPDFNLIEKQFHGVNMKLMKAGGYVNGLRIVRETKKRGMLTMIGCMVESTLGIRSAWNLSAEVTYKDLDGCLIVADEPFHLLHENEGQFSIPDHSVTTTGN